MKQNMKRAIALAFDVEGGFVNHPDDPGGATNHGVTRGTLAHYRGRPVSIQEVKDLTKDEAWTIFKELYWDKVGGDDLPAGVDIIAFDFGVNSGPRTAIEKLQEVVGVKVDGVLGPKTLAAVRASYEAGGLITEYTMRRLEYLADLKTFTTFGRGWVRRVVKVWRAT